MSRRRQRLVGDVLCGVVPIAESVLQHIARRERAVCLVGILGAVASEPGSVGGDNVAIASVLAARAAGRESERTKLPYDCALDGATTLEVIHVGER